MMGIRRKCFPSLLELTFCLVYLYWHFSKFTCVYKAIKILSQNKKIYILLEHIVETANHNECTNCKANRSTIAKYVKHHGYCGKISCTTFVSQNKCVDVLLNPSLNAN